MSKNKVNKNWLHGHINDPYVKLAQKEGFRARAAFKLQEIDEEEKLIRPGQVIVDLGCTPGSWSQYARRKLAGKEGGGIHGTIIGLDMLPMEPVADVHFILGDFREQSVLDELEVAVGGRKLDLVLSDMAPNLTGIGATDAARVEDIIDLALDFACAHLMPGGDVLIKTFQGTGFDAFVAEARKHYTRVKFAKPAASRSRSPELYLLARGRKAV